MIKPWPETEIVEVCWRLPIDNQRVMIYEKLVYSIEEIEKLRKLQNLSSQSLLTGEDD